MAPPEKEGDAHDFMRFSLSDMLEVVEAGKVGKEVRREKREKKKVGIGLQ